MSVKTDRVRAHSSETLVDGVRTPFYVWEMMLQRTEKKKTGKVAKSTVAFAIVSVPRKINDRDNSKFSPKTFSLLSARDNGLPRINDV